MLKRYEEDAGRVGGWEMERMREMYDEKGLVGS